MGAAVAGRGRGGDRRAPRVAACAALVLATLLGCRGAGDTKTGQPGSSDTEAPAAGPDQACPDAGHLSLRQRLAQTLFVGVDGSSAARIAELVDRREPVGGIFLAGTATTVFRDGTLRRLRGRPVPPLVAVDDEGGRVQRIDAVAGDLPSATRLGRETAERVRAVAEDRGRELARLGVTMAFAPVVDIGGHRDGDVIGDRAFSTHVAGVVRAAGAYAAGLRDAGILPTLKHFPGHGRATGDSHRGRAVTPPWSSVRGVDVAPYRALLDDGPVAVMVGHLVVPGLSAPGLPTSLDRAVYDYLRDDLDFDGLVVTDDLSRMRAITSGWSQALAVRRALAAGADMALLAGPMPLDRLLDDLTVDVVSGRLPRARVAEAATRVLAAKGCG